MTIGEVSHSLPIHLTHLNRSPLSNIPIFVPKCCKTLIFVQISPGMTESMCVSVIVCP